MSLRELLEGLECQTFGALIYKIEDFSLTLTSYIESSIKESLYQIMLYFERFAREDFTTMQARFWVTFLIMEWT